ncbi:MOSC domain-containing protein [Gayadomonas joobiniege]|uniref:MOSC domain-containing protein n=1 Tax=Gayadomonas joobiniege TaxID=1234606 RepID=UPI00037473C0|nr:MOSC domain-containing protein [Gayadomonas joobiniege]
MQVLSINVSKKRKIKHLNREIETGIFKQPLAENKVFIDTLGLVGDEQADLKNHGGPDKAVYAYGYQHYDYWRQVLPNQPLNYGGFGENLTLAELAEERVQIGDTFGLGEAKLQVTQPRVPCFKLGIKFDYLKMPKLFTQSLKTGIYFRVLKAGEVKVGDKLVLLEQARDSVTVQAVFSAYFMMQKAAATPVIKKAAAHPALSVEWRKQLEKYLARN